MPDHGWPDPAAAARLHRRLADPDDPVAPSDFADAFVEPLVAFLRAVEPDADDHFRVEAAGEAVLSVLLNPSVFDPARGNLPGFLRMAARRDLLNRQARERRHRDRQEPVDPVELGADAGNPECGGDLPSFDHPALAAEIAGFTDAERRVLDLMRAGERATAAFAAALGVADRPPGEQAAAAKRAKDRILKRLQRAGGRP